MGSAENEALALGFGWAVAHNPKGLPGTLRFYLCLKSLKQIYDDINRILSEFKSLLKFVLPAFGWSKNLIVCMHKS